MLDAAIKALTDMLRPPLRSVLIKSVLLALALIVVIGIVLQRLLASQADSGAAWAALAWFLSIMATLVIVTGAVFLMPAETNVVGSFFVDDVADAVERAHYPADLTGLALPIFTAVIEGLKFALLSVLVYLVALPFVLFAGFGVLIL